MDLTQVRTGFVTAGIPPQLVDEVIEAYLEAKRRYHLGDHRPQEVEGGRFSEAVFRVLQHTCGQTVTPLGKTLPKVDQLLAKFESATSRPDSERLHIPRTLKLIYDIRNKRDAAHLADGIDPNLQDATLVIGAMDWVLAELVRLHHNVPANDAQRIVDELVTRQVPVVQDFDGFLKLLNPRLSASEQCLVLLYHRGEAGAEYGQLEQWVTSKSRKNLRRTLRRLDEDRALVHRAGDTYRITRKGQMEVEARRLAA